MMKSCRLRAFLEIVSFLLMAIFVPQIIITLSDTLFAAAISYWLVVILVVLYVRKVLKKDLSYLHIRRIRLSDVGVGIGVGVLMTVIQLLPMFVIGMDLRMLAVPPDWPNIIIMSVFCILCVGLSEEILMRGILLKKTEELVNSKIMVVLINCLLFYMFHWPPIPFVFGQFFNLSVNTVILYLYLYRSKRKSIFSLVIAHGAYDSLIGFLLPVFIYLFWR